MAQGDADGLDAPALRAEVERALGAMEEVRRIKRSSRTPPDGIDNARGHRRRDGRHGPQAHLAQIDALLPTPRDAEDARSMRRRICVARAVVTGRVQGVFFRDTSAAPAQRRGVAGWAANRPDGTVEVWLEGPPDAVDSMLRVLNDGPPRAEVDRVDVDEAEPEGSAASTRADAKGAVPCTSAVPVRAEGTLDQDGRRAAGVRDRGRRRAGRRGRTAGAREDRAAVRADVEPTSPSERRPTRLTAPVAGSTVSA